MHVSEEEEGSAGSILVSPVKKKLQLQTKQNKKYNVICVKINLEKLQV